MRKALDLGMSVQEMVDASDFLGAWNSAYAWVPGKVETMTLIMDIKGVSFLEFPVLQAREPVKHNVLVWRGRLAYGIMVNCPMYMRVGMRIFRSFMPADTNGKIKIIGGKKEIKEVLGPIIGFDNL